MELDLFKRKLGGHKLVPDGYFSNINFHHKPIALWKRIADLVSRVKFDCGFVSGCCGNSQARSRGGSWSTCCCDACYMHRGYLDSVQESEFETVAALFKEKSGFLTPTGCALPMYMRSRTCLLYTCSFSRKNWSQEQRHAWSELHNVAFGNITDEEIDRVERLMIETGLIEKSEEEACVEVVA